MPYIKPREKPFAAVGRVLKGYDVTAAEMARRTGWSYHKSRDRMEKPELFTLGEIKILSQKFHIPIEELRAAVMW
jgi:hypothetical protein